MDNASAFLTPTSMIMGNRRIETRRGMRNINIDDIRQFRLAKSIRYQQRASRNDPSISSGGVTLDGLSSMNVTISVPKTAILGRSVDEKMDPLIDAKHYLGDSSDFTTSNQTALLKRFRRIMSSEEKRVLGITSDIVPRRFLRNHKAIKSIKEIQFSNPNSIVRKLASEKTLDMGSIPPHVKFMMSSAFNPNPNTDPMKNAESREIIEETQKNLFVIHALVGFNLNDRGFLNVFAPKWKQMDGTILSAGKPVLAKAAHYEIPELGIVKDNFLATIYSNLIYIRG
jgi:hypothetical protein